MTLHILALKGITGAKAATGGEGQQGSRLFPGLGETSRLMDDNGHAVTESQQQQITIRMMMMMIKQLLFPECPQTRWAWMNGVAQ